MGLKLMAEIGLDGSGFERGLRKVGEEAAASVKNLAIQAFGIYGVEQAIATVRRALYQAIDEHPLAWAFGASALGGGALGAAADHILSR